MKSIINIYLRKKKKLYCVFVDYKAAYDKIIRAILWEKVISSGINGYILELYIICMKMLNHVCSTEDYCLIIFNVILDFVKEKIYHRCCLHCS